MSKEIEQAGAEAVQEICVSLLKAAGACMVRHGDDPNSAAIIAAGFAMALRAIGDDIDRKIPLTVREMLAT